MVKNGMYDTVSKIILSDIVVALITTISVVYFLKFKVIFILLGLLTEVINFVLNGLIIKVHYSEKRNVFYTVILSLGYFRLIVIALIAYSISKINLNYCILFMIGFSLHFIALFLYGIRSLIKINHERK